MASTNFTTHYSIPTPLGTDLTTPMDYNEAAETVDAALFGAVTDAGIASDAATAAVTTANAAADAVDTLATDLVQEKGKIVALQTRVTNAENEIDDVRADASDMITAYNEPTATASHTYAIGDFFIYNNTLYKATAAIAIGATIVPDTNCETTNVSSELIEIKSALTENIGSITSTASDTFASAFAKLYSIINTAENNLSEKEFANIKLKFSDKIATLSNVRGETNNKSYVFVVDISSNPLTNITLMTILIGASGASVSNTTFNSDGTFGIYNAGSSDFHNIKIDVV